METKGFGSTSFGATTCSFGRRAQARAVPRVQVRPDAFQNGPYIFCKISVQAVARTLSQKPTPKGILGTKFLPTLAALIVAAADQCAERKQPIPESLRGSFEVGAVHLLSLSLFLSLTQRLR